MTIVATLFVLFALTLAHVYLLDGLDGWLFSQGLTEDTVYAAGYSDAAFRRVAIGMTADTVLTMLGKPLDRAREMSDEIIRKILSEFGAGQIMESAV